MSIGEKIVQLRKEKGWTQTEFAKKLGYLQPHVNRWEKKKKVPSLEALKRLAKLFDVSIDVLVLDEKDIKRLNIKDRDLLSRFKEFEKLSTTEKQSVISIIDSLLKTKTSD